MREKEMNTAGSKREFDSVKEAATKKFYNTHGACNHTSL